MHAREHQQQQRNLKKKKTTTAMYDHVPSHASQLQQV